VLRHGHLGHEPGHVGEATERAGGVPGPVEVHQEVERRERCHSVRISHRSLSSRAQLRASAVFWPMRKMTNSAGLTTATPIRQISRPLSRSFCVMVLRSHLTKYASCGVVPSSAPETNSLYRKPLTVSVILTQSLEPFGSNTAHWVPRS